MKKVFLLILLLPLCLANSQCQGVDKPADAPAFKWHPTLYQGDSRTRQMVGSSKRIRCESEEFDSLIGMHNSELVKVQREYYRIINLCEKWKK